jgi:hypothetical protein
VGFRKPAMRATSSAGLRAADIVFGLERARDRRQIPCVTFVSAVDGGERCARFAEPSPMLVCPRRAELIGVVGVLTVVLDAVQIAIGVEQDVIRCEREYGSVEEHVIRYAPCRLQVLGQERRRHRQRLAGTVEPCLVGGIDGNSRAGRMSMPVTSRIVQAFVALGCCSRRSHWTAAV